MTIDRAIEILNPDHRECYGNIEEVNEACRMGMEALERQRWIPCGERLPEAATNAGECVANQAELAMPECVCPKESSSEILQELADLDIGFRVFKQDDVTEMSTTYDYLFFCAINLGITLDKKVEQKTVCGSEILAYGKNEMVACFDPFVDWKVIETIIEYKPKKVVFESCSFASDADEKKADDAITAAVPGCEVYIVDLRQIVRRSQSEAFGEYRKGYFKALLDAAEWLENHSEELKYTLMNSTKGATACLKAMAQQLPEMLKYGRTAKIKVKLLNPKKVKEKNEKARQTAAASKQDWEKSAEEWAAFCNNGAEGNGNAAD